MDTLPQEKYFADLDQAVAEATAKSEEALKVAQTEVTNLRQQLLDYRNHADAEAKMNERWRDAESKPAADLAAAYSPLFFAKNSLLVTLLCVTIFL